MTGWSQLERFLQTDPDDIGCDEALAMLHVYVDLALDDSAATAQARHPRVAAHLLACGPCEDDFQGLLAAASIDRP